jgi:hypothetical protein
MGMRKQQRESNAVIAGKKKKKGEANSDGIVASNPIAFWPRKQVI